MNEKRSPMEREADKRAHRLAKYALEQRRRNRSFLDWIVQFNQLLDAYEEIEQRQIEEATR